MQLWGTSLDDFYTFPWHFLMVDNNSQLNDRPGSEFLIPDYLELLQIDIIVPIICYTIFWYSINMMATTHCWTNMQEGLHRKRLINVTTSLAHSSVSGFYFLIFLLRYPKLMFAATLNYYGYLDTQILMFSVGYFVYDLLDLLINDKISIQTGTLLVHHIASIFVLVVPFCTHKFLLFAYWALLMEVSSVFLHLRSILHFSKMSSLPQYSAITQIVLFLNLATFVVFRFILQMWMVSWAYVNKGNMHPYYFWVVVVAQTGFFLINVGLFLRILYSDGLMGSTKVSRSQLDALLEDNEYTALEPNGADFEILKEEIA